MNANDSLSIALHELATIAGDEPTLASVVHARVRRRQRRRRVVWVGTASATAAASLAGAGLVASATRRPTPVATGASPAASPTLPACADPTPPARVPDPGPPAIGQQTPGGARIVGQPTATAITVDVLGGPLAGTRLTLSVSSTTKVLLASPPPGNQEVPITAAQLTDGQEGKFLATRTGAATYALDELHTARATSGTTVGPSDPAGAAGPGDAGGAARPNDAGSGAKATTKSPPISAPIEPPAVGDVVKVGGTVTALTSTSLSVQVGGGNVAGLVTFALRCQPATLRAGDQVLVVGTRTGPGTYEATNVILAPAPGPAAVSKG